MTILILTESIDITADKVCQWLSYYKVNFLRINFDIESIQIKEVELSNKSEKILISVREQDIDINRFNVIWFRRGAFNEEINMEIKNNIFPNDEAINELINRHLSQENKILHEFVYKYISENVVQINNPLKYNINKLECLYEAKKIGLKIPNTLITKSKEKIQKKLISGEKLITKCISDNMLLHTSSFYMSQHTAPVQNKHLRIRSTFSHSLFQNDLNKKGDIRFFFFDDIKVSTIIYSTQRKDIVDFRVYSYLNACIFEMPQDIELKLINLAKRMGLESGSADLVLTQNDEIIFLEINPVGQIDFISVLNNLNIEKDIALKLMSYEKKQ